MAKQKFYVVWKGHQTGIFRTWRECQAHTRGFGQSRYRSFKTFDEAKAAFENPELYGVGLKKVVIEREAKAVKPPSYEARPLSEQELQLIGQPILASYCVDAVCGKTPGELYYRGVRTETGQEVFRQGPFADGSNDVGEFLAVVHALAWLKQQNITDPVYTASVKAWRWRKEAKCHTQLLPSENNAPLFVLIRRAEKWLQVNFYENKVLKWHTKAWGENPADYGRK